MPWFVWLFVAGIGAVAYARSSSGPTLPAGALSPSGKPWPGDLDSAHVKHAVDLALLVETDPAALHAFADRLQSYDPAQAALLAQKAGP